MSEPVPVFISDTESASLVSRELALAAVQEAFLALADGSGQLNPVVMAPGMAPEDVFSLKSGSAASAGLVGFKCGAYFTGADALELPRHSSNTLLLDPASGRLRAVVGASEVNCYRTAAANAVAARALARPDSATLTLFGAGHQAWYEIDALLGVFDLRTIRIVSRNPARGEALAGRLRAELEGVDVQAQDAEQALPEADIVVTVTTAREPLFDAALVQPGCHISAMGCDQQGKQELPVELLKRARLVADLPEQSLRVGEFQHVADAVADGSLTVDLLGDILSGKRPGRSSDSEITIFDSSGVALQDLFVADRILQAYQEAHGSA